MTLSPTRPSTLREARVNFLKFCLLALIFALSVTMLRAQSPPPDQFTIIALPDMQFYSQSYPNILTTNMNWIVNNADPLRIKYVASLGDSVNTSTTAAQWQTIDSAVRLLDQAHIPYGISIGNHDYDTGPMNIAPRTTTQFDQYFGPSRYLGTTWYHSDSFPAGSNANFYNTLIINGTDYLFLHMEFFARDAALTWARSVLAANPTKKVIVVTHGYGNPDGFRIGPCDPSGPGGYGLPNDNNGDMLWAKFVSQYPNIVMVLSGHMHAPARNASSGASAVMINEMMSGHYETEPNKGNGYLRILTITPSQNRIDVKTYSPFANLYKTDDANEFTVSLNAPPVGTVAGQASIRGRVQQSNCTDLSGAKVTYTSSLASGSTSTDAMGYYTAAVPSPSTYTVTASASGFKSASSTVNVLDGYTLPARFLLSPLPPDFTMAVAPAAQKVTQGNTATYTTTLTSLYGYSGTATLSVAGLPSGAVAAFNPATLTGSGTSTLSIKTATSTPVGTYSLPVKGTSGSLSHTATVSMTVQAPAPDFSLGISPTSQSTPQGASTRYLVNISALNKFTGTVSFAVSGIPSGASASFSPATITNSGLTTLIVSTTKTAPQGSFPLTVRATSGTIQHSVSTTLVVTATQPTFNIIVSPLSRAIRQNGTTTYTVTISPVNGFTGTVTLSATGFPTGASAKFSPASVTTSGTSVMTISCVGTTPPGTYTILVKGTNGTNVRSTPVRLWITGFTITVSPTSLTIAKGSSGTYSAKITAKNGYTDTDTMSVSGLPSGVTATFSPTSVAGSGTSAMKVSVSTSAVSGSYTLTVKAASTSANLYHTAKVTLQIP